MNKKIKLIVILITIILLSFAFLIYSNQHHNFVSVDKTTFELPEGYMVGTKNSLDDVNITNGNDSIFIRKYSDDNITKYVNQYKNDVEKNNHNITLFNFNVNGLNVFKSENTNTGSEHFWFIKDHHVYSIYNWGTNPNMDNIVLNLINSMN